jgi:hypothetical protein
MHFTVMVTGEDVDEQLAPFEEGEDGGEWDWYQIGGRWHRSLKLLPGREGAIGSPSWGHADEEFRDGWVDSARKCDIDWQGMRDDAEQKAREEWYKVREITGGRTWIAYDVIVAPLEGLLTTDPDRYWRDLTLARKTYNDQPAITALHEAKYRIFNDNLTLDVDDYVQLARESTGAPHATLHNGEWLSDQSWSPSPEQQREWDAKFWALIDSLSDDTLLTLVDCHI